MGITFTNNWKNIADKLRSTLRAEFKGSLPVYINDENQSAGGQHMRLELAGTSLTQKLLDCELREYSVNMFYIFESPNIKKNSLDHILRYTSRIEQLMQNNISLTLTDSTAAVNCRIESTELEQGEDNTYLVSFEWKCQHLSGLSEVVATTPALLNNFSLNFDGTDDYVVTDLGDLTAPFTLSGWVKGSGFSSNAYHTIFSHSNDFRLYSYDVNLYESGTDTGYNFTGASIGWTHIVIMDDGSNRSLYIDGSLAAANYKSSSSSTEQGDNTLIGQWSTSTSRPFLGDIDEVAIWDKALSATEITAIYNSKAASSTTLDLGYDTPDYTSSSNLVAYWRMGSGRYDSFGFIFSKDDVTFGNELFADTTFDDASYWTISTIDDGETGEVSGGKLSIVALSDITITRTGVLTDATLYRLNVEIDSYTSGGLTGVANSDFKLFTPTGAGTYDIYFKSDGTSFQLKFGTGTTFSITRMSLKEVTSTNAGAMTNMRNNDITSEVPKQITSLQAVPNTYSLDFDGTDDHINCGDDTSLDITTSITISAWVKADSYSDHSWIAGRDNGTLRNYNIYLTDAGKFYFEFWHSSGTLAQVKGTSTISTGQWYHVVGTYDGTNQKIYINAILEDSDGEADRTIDNDDVSFVIGAKGNGTSSNFNGKIDEVAVWNTALDPDAVKAIYNSGKPTDLTVANGAYDIYTANDIEIAQSFAQYSSKESGWTVSGDVATYDAVSTTQYIQVPFANGASIVVGDMYKVTFTISNVEAGKKAYFSIWGHESGSPHFQTYTEYDEGTHTEYLQIATNNDYTTSRNLFLNALNSSNGGSFSISNMSITRADNLKGYWRMGDGTLDDGNVDGNGLIADQVNATLGSELITDPNFDTDVASGAGDHWTVETGWVIADGIATKTAGVANFVYTSGSIASAGSVYKVTYTLTRTAGVTRLYLGDNNISGDITSNGTYTFYGIQTGSTNDIRFYGNSTFAGTIDNVSVKQVNGNAGIMTNMTVTDIGITAPNYAYALDNNLSLAFDGTNDYVSLGDFSPVDNATTITIGAWVKATNTGGTEPIFSKFKDDNENLQLLVSGNTVSFAVENSNDCSGTFAYTSNDWNYIVAVFDGSGSANAARCKIYLNGVSQTLTFSGTFPTAIDDLSGYDTFIGRRDTGYFNGNIDEVSLWSTALGATEILELYNNGAPLDLKRNVRNYTSSHNLIAWWRMGDGDTFNLIEEQVTPHTLGDNILTNGDFSDNSVPDTWNGSAEVELVGWGSGQTHDATHHFSITEQGRCRIQAASSNIDIRQDNVLVVGKLYYYSIEVTDVTAGSIRLESQSEGDISSSINSTGTHTGYFIATYTRFYIKRVSGETDVTFDNVSVKLVNGNAGLMTNMAVADIEEETP